jgi:predicted Zn-dependent protease
MRLAVPAVVPAALGLILNGTALCGHVAAASAAQSKPTGAAVPPSRQTPPGAFQALAAKAETARSAGRLAEAAGFYEKAVALRPAWAEGRLTLATILCDLQRYPEARDHLQRLTTAGQGGGTAWGLLGLASSRLRDHEAALTALGRARDLGISSPELLSAVTFEAALLLNRAGHHDAAFDILRVFASEGKDSPAVIVAFGLSLLRLRQMPDEVPIDKREMVGLAGRGGYQMARPRRSAVGRLALEEVVSRYPAEANVHYALGTYLAPDDPDAAAEEFRRELRMTPDHSEALIQLAHLETRRGDANAALPYAERAVSLVPDVPAGRLVLGRALLELERTDEAIVQLERAAVLAPSSADVHFALSRAYQRAGRAAEATRERDEFQRLEKLGREREGKVGAGTPPSPGAGVSNDRGGLN